MFFPSAFSVRREGFSCKFIRRDHKYTFGLRNVNDLILSLFALEMRALLLRPSTKPTHLRDNCLQMSRPARLVSALAFVAINLCAQTPYKAADLGRQVLDASLDPAQCYHVHDLRIHQSDADFYLTDGYLIFGKPVDGVPVSAVFTTEVEGGDAEVVLLPPDRAERRTLAAFTSSPNLNEHFTHALFFFTDGTAQSLAESIRAEGGREKDPAVGLLMAEKWAPTITAVSGGLETRLVLDLFTPASERRGFFQATLRGRRLGEFEIVRDEREPEQILAGKITESGPAIQWDTWTRFVARDRRNMPAPAPEEEILAYHIDATVDTALSMHCVTRIQVRITAQSSNVLPFEIDAAMRVVSAKVDGIPVETFRRESPRDGLMQDSGDILFLVVPAQPFEPGSVHEIEIVHEGKVFQDTGNQIYTVRARGTWYPGRGPQFAAYDVTCRYPASLDLISAGAIKEDHTENGVRTTRRVPEGRLRLLGVNLGSYVRHESQQNGITLAVSANRAFEDSLRTVVAAPIVPPVPLRAGRGGPGRGPEPPSIQLAPPPANPAARLDAIFADMQAAIAYFRSKFGDPPLNRIEVSPVTGRFGQGFSGMIYLPTVTYLDPALVSERGGSALDQAFMDELLRAHEIAHQWWGNIVTTDSYHHEWLMESLASYSALMFLESTLGQKAVEKILDYDRAQLLVKGPDGATAESRGPVVEGRRLESSTAPGASDAVIYGKGTWIIHMLRRRLGDTNFLKMLAELRRRYEWKTVTTDDFRQLCAEFLPPGSPDRTLSDFFDQWVYDTGMPTLQLTYSVNGRKLTGTVTQTDAPDDFSVTVPVEIRSGTAKPIVRQVRSANGPVKFTADVAGPGAKAVLDPGWSILRR